MFKGIATLVMVLMGISSAYADMTGYDQLKSSTNLKSVYLSGYMFGFKFGETIGVAKGVSNTFVRFKELSDSMKENNDKKILKVAK